MPEAKELKPRMKRFGTPPEPKSTPDAPPAQPIPVILGASVVQAEPVAPSGTDVTTAPKDIPQCPPTEPLEEIELCGVKTIIFRREKEALLGLIAENHLDLDTIGRRIIFGDGSITNMNLASIPLNLGRSGQKTVGQLLGVFRKLHSLSLQDTGITNLHGFGQVLVNLFNNSGVFVRPEGGNTIIGYALRMLAERIMEEERLAELVHKPGDTIVVIAKEGVPVSPAPVGPDIEIPIALDTPSPVAAPPATTAEAGDGFGEHADWLAEGAALQPDAYGPDGKRDLEASPPPIAAPRLPTPAPIPEPVVATPPVVVTPRPTSTPVPTPISLPAPTPRRPIPAPVAPAPVVPTPAPAPRPRVMTPPPPPPLVLPSRWPSLPKFPSLPSIASIRALTRTRAAGIVALLVVTGVTAYATLGNLQPDGNAVKPVPAAPAAPPVEPPLKPSGDPADPRPPKPAAPRTPAKPQPPPEAAEIDNFEQAIYFQWEKDGGLSVNPSEGIDIPADGWHYRNDGRGTPRLFGVTLIKAKDGKQYKTRARVALFGAANDKPQPQRLYFELIR